MRPTLGQHEEFLAAKGYELDCARSSLCGDSANGAAVYWDGQIDEAVVLKYHEDPFGAGKEAHMVELFQEAGIPTLELPSDRLRATITETPWGGSYVATRYDPQLAPLTRLPWREPPGSQTYEEHLVPTVQRMVDRVAGMHQSGFYHGDWQPKNAGTTHGELVAYDLEASGRSVNDGKASPERTRDLTSLGKSLLISGFLRTATTPVRQQEMDTTIFTRYAEVVGTDVAIEEATTASVKVDEFVMTGGLQRAIKRFSFRTS